LGGDKFALIFPETNLEQGNYVISQIKKDLKIFPYLSIKLILKLKYRLLKGWLAIPKMAKLQKIPYL